MPSNLRIATIGTWGHLGEPLSEIAAMSDAQIVAHARAMPDDDIAYVRTASKTDSLPWFDDYHRMLRDVRPDVVVVSTRIDRINPIAIDVAEAGCHLISEKPLAIDHANLHRLQQVLADKKVECIAMLGNGRHPVMQAAAGAIRAGQIGEVVLLNARKSYRWGQRPEWFGQREIYGGSIAWVTIHALEMIHHLSGQTFVTVGAMQSNRVHPERSGCEDNGVLNFGLSGGGHASVSFDLLRPKAATTHGDDWVRIVGSRGVIEASMDRGFCKMITDDSPEQELPLPPRAAYYAPLLRKIIEGKPLAETRIGIMLTHVALCARDAADQSAILRV